MPDNPYSEASDYFSSSYSYMSSYNGLFKNLDNNKAKDLNQLSAINALQFTDKSKAWYYWMASRAMWPTSSGVDFSILDVNSDGIWFRGCLCGVGEGSEPIGNSPRLGFRPVFRLKSTVKLDSSNGKDGTAEDKAYDLK